MHRGHSRRKLVIAQKRASATMRNNASALNTTQTRQGRRALFEEGRRVRSRVQGMVRSGQRSRRGGTGTGGCSETSIEQDKGHAIPERKKCLQHTGPAGGLLAR